MDYYKDIIVPAIKKSHHELDSIERSIISSKYRKPSARTAKSKQRGKKEFRYLNKTIESQKVKNISKDAKFRHKALDAFYQFEFDGTFLA
jgi:hypothetical protein